MKRWRPKVKHDFTASMKGRSPNIEQANVENEKMAS